MVSYSDPHFDWSAGSAVRRQREALGLSQSQVAEIIGISKSLLSHIEAGTRTPTSEQTASLASVLKMPVELISLNGGRLPDDVATIVEESPAVAVAAVRQHVEADAILYVSAPEVVPHPRPDRDPPRNVNIPKQIDAEKTSASYRAHSYHTKVPPEAIRPFIRAYSQPGDVVVDSFCGSGMTGVAALTEGRNALLSDLSPAAVHIARNYTTMCDLAALKESLREVSRIVGPTMQWLYQPARDDRTVEYTTWSDVFACPHCRREILFWDVMIAKDGEIDGDGVRCPSCRKTTRKSEFIWLAEKPVQSHTSRGSNRIDTHSPTVEELALIESADRTPIPYWIPKVPFSEDREMWRASHRAMGISDVAGFFTRRNLHALAALRHAIVTCSQGRVREALMFAFTAAVNRASRRYQWNAKRPTNVMTGTLYISSLRYEWNVWSLFRRKAADVIRYYERFPRSKTLAEVFQRSATDLGCLPDGCADMAFIDPPFGSNIFYADASILWDAWLGQITDPSGEIVVNKHRKSADGGKNLKDYESLLERSFGELSRVVRKDGYAVLAFSNSDDAVWNSLQSAIARAGWNADRVHVLNKGQPSIKGVKGVTGKEQVTTLDLLLCLRRKATAHIAALNVPPTGFIDRCVQEFLRSAAADDGKRTDEIYSAAIRKAIESGYSVAGIRMPFIAERCAALGAIATGGKWSLADRDAPQPDFVEGYLTPSAQYPRSNRNRTVAKAFAEKNVSGGRDSAFYVAHSYHTKVPPEAIRPFIEHYTAPGDVVLDLFCGSGMTGVATALAGRKCILNDLSPAAVHLAWNHTRPCDPDQLEAEFNLLRQRVAERLSKLYFTRDSDGRPAQISWTMWSTRHLCPACGGTFLLWDAVDHAEGRIGKSVTCPKCRHESDRKKLKSKGYVPAWICYETAEGKRGQKKPDSHDIARLEDIAAQKEPLWYPTTDIGSDREMYIRCALHLRDIKTVADFYTPRNRTALAILWSEITAVRDDRLKRALAFAFTNTAWHGTKMRRFNARGGMRPLTGTLYVPQLSSEANVLDVMTNKIVQLSRYYRLLRPLDSCLPAIRLGSATNLHEIGDGTIDYVFTDPPFGSNIFYADCNLIWESWLGRFTETHDEAVMNRSKSEESGGKSLREYSQLMAASMKEAFRVLKPGGWATIVFHNTDSEVWNAIRGAAVEAGFEFHEATSLDRKQKSHKGYKGGSESENVAHFDVIFNLRKPTRVRSGAYRSEPQTNLAAVVERIATQSEVVQRGLQGVHAEVMRVLASNGSSNFPSYSDVRAIWDQVAKRT